MRRVLLFSGVALLLGLGPVTGHAASAVPQPPVAGNPAISLAQGWQGWWEREHEEDRARRGYWALRGPQLERYNRLQIEVNRLRQQRNEIDERIARAEREQRRILGFAGR